MLGWLSLYARVGDEPLLGAQAVSDGTCHSSLTPSRSKSSIEYQRAGQRSGDGLDTVLAIVQVPGHHSATRPEQAVLATVPRGKEYTHI